MKKQIKKILIPCIAVVGLFLLVPVTSTVGNIFTQTNDNIALASKVITITQGTMSQDLKSTDGYTYSKGTPVYKADDGTWAVAIVYNEMPSGSIYQTFVTLPAQYVNNITKRSQTYSGSLTLGQENLYSKANITTPSKPAPKPQPNNGKLVNIYRLYNTRSQEHLYTASAYEAEQLPKISRDWQFEGVAWKSPKTSNTPVYRVYNPNSGEHLYTSSNYEADSLARIGWRCEGIAFYSDSSNKIATYRLYNPAAGIGSHFVTMNTYERDVLKTRGWKYEGIAWYAN